MKFFEIVLHFWILTKLFKTSYKLFEICGNIFKFINIYLVRWIKKKLFWVSDLQKYKRKKWKLKMYYKKIFSTFNLLLYLLIPFNFLAKIKIYFLLEEKRFPISHLVRLILCILSFSRSPFSNVAQYRSFNRTGFVTILKYSLDGNLKKEWSITEVVQELMLRQESAIYRYLVPFHCLSFQLSYSNIRAPIAWKWGKNKRVIFAKFIRKLSFHTILEITFF